MDPSRLYLDLPCLFRGNTNYHMFRQKLSDVKTVFFFDNSELKFKSHETCILKKMISLDLFITTTEAKKQLQSETDI